MKALTLRNIPLELRQIIQRLAAEKHSSLAQTVLSLLAKGAGIGERKQVLHHDLDHLAGTWSSQDARDFQRALEAQRAGDPELWK